MFGRLLKLSLLALSFSGFLAEVDVGVIIQTEDGPVKGQLTKTYGGKEVVSFYGIPYAEPPLGELRFKKPQPVKPWSKVMDATRPPHSCYQRQPVFFTFIDALKDWIPTTPLSEDCLKLNVFVPNSVSPKEILPIIIFIHGGGFSVGSSTARSNDGLVLAGEENIIVVTINYRVSSLGFLYLDTPGAEGNAGLYDQLSALKWVKRNARYFGGDPATITLAGQSAGAISVGFHTMNPEAKNLFKRVVIMSGSQTSPWGLTTKENALNLSLATASYSGCEGNASTILKCLRLMEPSELIANEPLKEYGQVVNFQPIIDKEIVPEAPADWLKSDKLPEGIDVLAGNVYREGVALILTLLPFYFPFQKERSPTITYKDFPSIVKFLFEDETELKRRTIELVYESMMHRDNATGVIEATELLFGDSQFTCPVYQFVESVNTSKNKLYSYLFHHRSSNNKLPSWAGSHHGEDLIYLFGIPLLNNTNFTEEEIKLSKTFMRFFANFVKTGNPNGINYRKATSNETVDWSIFDNNDKSNQKSYVISTEPRLVKPPRQQICKFWNQALPNFIKDLKEIKFLQF